MATTLRNMDNAAEMQVSAYLDKNFYPLYTQNFVRYTDRKTQMSGIDVSFDLGSLKDILVDEKALSHYVNRDLPTFAFELSFRSSRGDIIPGWFYDEQKRTEYYLISWIKATKDKGFQASDIMELDTLLVSRSAIQAMLASYGLTKAVAESKASAIRQNSIRGVSEKNLSVRPYYFYYSDQLAELPINLIVRKEILVSVATRRFTIIPTDK